MNSFASIHNHLKTHTYFTAMWRSGAMGKGVGLAINRSQVQMVLEVT